MADVDDIQRLYGQILTVYHALRDGGSLQEVTARFTFPDLDEEERRTVFAAATERLAQEKAFWRKQADDPIMYGGLMVLAAVILGIIFGFSQLDRMTIAIVLTFAAGLSIAGYGIFCKINPLP